MKRLGLALGSLGLGLLSGCASLPDLQLAKQAKSEGDLATAEANFRGLAEQGYVDGEIGLAVCVNRPGQNATEAEIADFLGPKIARYKMPKRFLFWEALPKSGYGKVPKRLVKDELEKRGELDFLKGKAS